MVVGFTTICAISECHQWSCEFEYHLWWGVLDATLCDKVWNTNTQSSRFSFIRGGNHQPAASSLKNFTT
jgi:hypothetical protein